MYIIDQIVVEVQDLIVVLLVMVTVVPQHVVLVYVVHDMDSKQCSNLTKLISIEICNQYHSLSCGTVGLHCAYRRSTDDTEPATIEGVFRGTATYYNESQVSTQYSTCGTERGQPLDENDPQVFVAALNQAQFDPYTVDGIPSNNPICQKKAVVRGPKGQITVRFVDRCPDCKMGKNRIRIEVPRVFFEHE